MIDTLSSKESRSHVENTLSCKKPLSSKVALIKSIDEKITNFIKLMEVIKSHIEKAYPVLTFQNCKSKNEEITWNNAAFNTG